MSIYFFQYGCYLLQTEKRIYLVKDDKKEYPVVSLFLFCLFSCFSHIGINMHYKPVSETSWRINCILNRLTRICLYVSMFAWIIRCVWCYNDSKNRSTVTLLECNCMGKLRYEMHKDLIWRLLINLLKINWDETKVIHVKLLKKCCEY